jgi:hypothetical protein
MAVETEKEMYERLLKDKAGGNESRLGRKLLKLNVDAKTENDGLRDEIEELKAELKTATLPKDHVAVPRDQFAQLDEYRKLGDPKAIKATADELAAYKALGEPKAIEASLKELPAVKGTLARVQHEAVLDAVSKGSDGRERYNSVVLKRIVPEGVKFVPATHTVKDARGKEVEVQDWDVIDTGPDGKARTRTREEWEADPDVRPMLPALKPSTPFQQQQQQQQTPRSTSPYRDDGGSSATYRSSDRQAAINQTPAMNGAASIL